MHRYMYVFVFYIAYLRVSKARAKPSKNNTFKDTIAYLQKTKYV